MAHLLITDDAITIDLSRGERFEAAHGDQTFPRSAISGVRAVPDCIAEVHGLKWAGTELSGIRVGSFHEDQRVTFAICHGHKPGIVIDLANSKYDRVVLSVETRRRLRLACPHRICDASARAAVRTDPNDTGRPCGNLRI